MLFAVCGGIVDVKALPVQQTAPLYRRQTPFLDLQVSVKFNYAVRLRIGMIADTGSSPVQRITPLAHI